MWTIYTNWRLYGRMVRRRVANLRVTQNGLNRLYNINIAYILYVYTYIHSFPNHLFQTNFVILCVARRRPSLVACAVNTWKANIFRVLAQRIGNANNACLPISNNKHYIMLYMRLYSHPNKQIRYYFERNLLFSLIAE